MLRDGLSIVEYQPAKYDVQLFSPPDLSSAADDAAPGLSLMPSVAPFTIVGEPVSSVNLPAASFDSMIRRYSRPPALFFAFSGTMKFSPAAMRVQSTGSFAPSRSGVYVAVVRKSFGATGFCSFSSQEPDGMNAALPWFHWVWDWMWSSPSVPCMK